MRPAVRHLLVDEGVVIVGRRQGDARMLRLERLHQHPPAARPAARPARHLGEQLERPLGGAEVGHVQADVRVDDADQRHVGEVQPLGDHLRAEQDVDLAARGRRPARLAWLPGRFIVSLSIRRTT